jgi:RNA recognition motif-containing protein
MAGKLYVGNLPYTMTDSDLRSLFERRLRRSARA